VDIIISVFTFLSGLLVGWNLKVVISKRSSVKNNSTSQIGNAAGGDIIAGNSNKTNSER
jgi:hypothetical protein